LNLAMFSAQSDPSRVLKVRKARPSVSIVIRYIEKKLGVGKARK